MARTSFLSCSLFDFELRLVIISSTVTVCENDFIKDILIGPRVSLACFDEVAHMIPAMVKTGKRKNWISLRRVYSLNL